MGRLQDVRSSPVDISGANPPDSSDGMWFLGGVPPTVLGSGLYGSGLYVVLLIQRGPWQHGPLTILKGNIMKKMFWSGNEEDLLRVVEFIESNTKTTIAHTTILEGSHSLILFDFDGKRLTVPSEHYILLFSEDIFDVTTVSKRVHDALIGAPTFPVLHDNADEINNWIGYIMDNVEYSSVEELFTRTPKAEYIIYIEQEDMDTGYTLFVHEGEYVVLIDGRFSIGGRKE